MNKDNLELLISPFEIIEKLNLVAGKIEEEYREKELTIVMIMKGSVCLCADLIRSINLPFTIQHISASSYGSNGAQRGSLTITEVEHLDLSSKHVLIVDDIFDTGHTMVSIVDHFKAKNPQSLKTLVLLLKNVPRTTKYLPDYSLFQIENRFVVGYGLDYKEYYRGLPGIYAFIDDKPI